MIRLSSLVLFVLISALSFPSTLAAQDEISLAEQNAESAERVIQEIWNEQEEDVRSEVAEELYVSQFDFHSPTSDDVMGCPRSMFLSTISNFHHSIPGLQIEVESIVASDDMAIVQYTLTGTPDSSGFSLPEGTSLSFNDEPVTWEGVFIYRFEEGKVAEEWWYWDNPFAE